MRFSRQWRTNPDNIYICSLTLAKVSSFSSYIATSVYSAVTAESTVICIYHPAQQHIYIYRTCRSHADKHALCLFNKTSMAFKCSPRHIHIHPLASSPPRAAPHGQVGSGMAGGGGSGIGYRVSGIISRVTSIKKRRFAPPVPSPKGYLGRRS